MAKRKRSTRRGTRPAAANRVPRKEPYSRDRMDVVIDRVKDQAGRLHALARSMAEGELDAVVIDGHAMLIRGLNQIDNFIDNASRAVREAKSAKKGL
jgi:hypothetical protein